LVLQDEPAATHGRRSMPRVKGIEEAKAALEGELRALCERGSATPVLVPSLRELSERHSLSKSLVQRVVRSLCVEGLLYPVHGMGTFAGRSPAALDRVFLFLYDNTARDAEIRSGFEARMSSLGGATLAMPLDEGLRQRAEGLLPTVLGAWDPTFSSLSDVGPIAPESAVFVGLKGRIDPSRGISVGFDEVSGGRTAALHLLSLGARRLLMLGVHAPDAPPGALDWSRERAEGFLQAVQSVGLEASAKVVVPNQVLLTQRPPDPYDYFAMGRAMGAALGPNRDVEGVVCVNDMVAYGYLSSILRQGLSPSDAPAVIGFDSRECRLGTFLSSLMLSWHELGRVAASAVFGWTSQTDPLKPRVEPVAMRQLTRLSSRRGWLSQAPALCEALAEAESEADLF
jgi:hypothetical protein